MQIASQTLSNDLWSFELVRYFRDKHDLDLFEFQDKFRLPGPPGKWAEENVGGPVKRDIMANAIDNRLEMFWDATTIQPEGVLSEFKKADYIFKAVIFEVPSSLESLFVDRIEPRDKRYRDDPHMAMCTLGMTWKRYQDLTAEDKENGILGKMGKDPEVNKYIAFNTAIKGVREAYTVDGDAKNPKPFSENDGVFSKLLQDNYRELYHVRWNNQLTAAGVPQFLPNQYRVINTGVEVKEEE